MRGNHATIPDQPGGSKGKVESMTVVDFRAWKLAHRIASKVAEARRLGARISAKASNVTPRKPRRDAAATISDQYSGGSRPRCTHLRTAGPVAPTSDANSSGDDQSAMMARAEETMPDCLGQSVLKVKPNVSYDSEIAKAHDVPMAKEPGETEFEASFRARVAAARRAAGKTQEEMATLLNMRQGRYKQYETRSLLPHFYVERFCLATSVTSHWLMTGKGSGPMVERKRRRDVA